MQGEKCLHSKHFPVTVKLLKIPRKSICAGGGLFPAAFGARAAQGHIATGNAKANRQRDFRHHAQGGERDISNLAADIAEEMAMLVHVGTEAGGSAVESNLLDQPALHQEAEAIIDGGEGDFRHAFARAIKDFFGSGMVVALGDDLENLLALAGETKPARREFFLKTLFPGQNWRRRFDIVEITEEWRGVN